MENNNFDELLYSLPDYITGELDDENLKVQIESKLLIDSSFREEYDSLKSTMNFLEEAELEAPSEVYFANLQANILSKVHKENVPERESVFSKVLGYWKVFVPALTVCIVLIIYTQNMNMNTTSIPIDDKKTQTVFTDKNPNKNQDTSTDEKVAASEQNVIPQDNTSTESSASTNVVRHKRADSFSPSQSISSDENLSAGDEIEGGSIIFGKDDDSQAQDEYDNLSTDDQLDILQSLRDKKL